MFRVAELHSLWLSKYQANFPGLRWHNCDERGHRCCVEEDSGCLPKCTIHPLVYAPTSLLFIMWPLLSKSKSLEIRISHFNKFTMLVKMLMMKKEVLSHMSWCEGSSGSVSIHLPPLKRLWPLPHCQNATSMCLHQSNPTHPVGRILLRDKEQTRGIAVVFNSLKQPTIWSGLNCISIQIQIHLLSMWIWCKLFYEKSEQDGPNSSS